MIYAATIFALFRDIEITTAILSQYPPLCQQKRDIDDKTECQKILSGIFVSGFAHNQLNVLIENACSWAVEYAIGDCVPNQGTFEKYRLKGKCHVFLNFKRFRRSFNFGTSWN